MSGGKGWLFWRSALRVGYTGEPQPQGDVSSSRDGACEERRRFRACACWIDHALLPMNKILVEGVFHIRSGIWYTKEPEKVCLIVCEQEFIRVLADEDIASQTLMVGFDARGTREQSAPRLSKNVLFQPGPVIVSAPGPRIAEPEGRE